MNLLVFEQVISNHKCVKSILNFKFNYIPNMTIKVAKYSTTYVVLST